MPVQLGWSERLSEEQEMEVRILPPAPTMGGGVEGATNDCSVTQLPDVSSSYHRLSFGGCTTVRQRRPASVYPAVRLHRSLKASGAPRKWDAAEITVSLFRPGGPGCRPLRRSNKPLQAAYLFFPAVGQLERPLDYESSSVGVQIPPAGPSRCRPTGQGTGLRSRRLEVRVLSSGPDFNSGLTRAVDSKVAWLVRAGDQGMCP
jgi:hypothetical protein